MTSKISWSAATVGQVVAMTEDYQVVVSELVFDTPLKGVKGYALFYRPNMIRQAEGVDIVTAIGQMYRDQRILDKVKSNPKLLTDDPEVQTLQSFFGEPESQTRN